MVYSNLDSREVRHLKTNPGTIGEEVRKGASGPEHKGEALGSERPTEHGEPAVASAVLHAGEGGPGAHQGVELLHAAQAGGPVVAPRHVNQAPQGPHPEAAAPAAQPRQQ